MDIHLRKLNAIKKNVVTKTMEETKKMKDAMQKRHNDKVRTFEFLKQERELDINRGNRKLLEKLVEISKGKHVSCEIGDLLIAKRGTADASGDLAGELVVGDLPSQEPKPLCEEARDSGDRAGQLQVREEALRVPGRDLRQGS